MTNRYAVSLCTAFLIISNTIAFAQESPFDFIQRPDVGREINLQPAQLELIQRLAPVCDAQCQARVMDILMNSSVENQSLFLSASETERAQIAANLDQTARENIENQMLNENVLAGEQMDRFLQLRTQGLGNDAFLTDRVSGLLGLSGDQVSQLRAVQDTGSALINACQALPGLSEAQIQQGVQLIQNNLIDQSINILNGAQIEIFANLAGSTFNFNSPGQATDPNQDTNGESPTAPASPDGEGVAENIGGSNTRNAPVQARNQASGTTTAAAPNNGSNSRTRTSSRTRINSRTNPVTTRGQSNRSATRTTTGRNSRTGSRNSRARSRSAQPSQGSSSR